LKPIVDAGALKPSFLLASKEANNILIRDLSHIVDVLSPFSRQQEAFRESMANLNRQHELMRVDRFRSMQQQLLLQEEASREKLKHLTPNLKNYLRHIQESMNPMTSERRSIISTEDVKALEGLADEGTETKGGTQAGQ
jgi:phosphoenolpyruvate carboxylase